MHAQALQLIHKWFQANSWKPFGFQERSWKAVLDKKHGIVNAPTGSGKTYSLLLPMLEEMARTPKEGLQLIWISPIRALTKEIHQSTERALFGLGYSFNVGIRTGDTSAKDKSAQNRKMPHILITTPESLHVLLAQKKYRRHFTKLRFVVVDEWHELLGSKRGNMTELALARFKTLQPELLIWGISATIGNLDNALEVTKAGVVGVLLRTT